MMTACVNHPTKKLMYALLGVLVLLLILMIVNDRNWRPVKGKSLHYQVTDYIITYLEQRHVPIPILRKFSRLKTQEFASIETFIAALETDIGKKYTENYLREILKYSVKPTWTATSNYSQSGAFFAVDQNLDTYWSSYAPLSFGMFFQVDIREPAEINGVMLQIGEDEEFGQPDNCIVKTSLDGEHWQTAFSERRIVSENILAIPFQPVQVRYVQILQHAGASTLYPWRIHEIGLLQAIVPWQFARTTFIILIVGVLFTMLAMFLFTASPLPRRETGLLTIAMTGILLLGWGLRTYHLGDAELSRAGLRYFSALHVEETDHLKWITTYFQETETGRSWLTLLIIRQAYQFCQEYCAAFRIVPAICGSALSLLAFGIWAIGKKGTTLHEPVRPLAEGVFVSALTSVAGGLLLPARSGDWSLALLVLTLLYLAAADRFVYQSRNYGGLAILILAACAGYALSPVMLFVPAGILLFGVGSLIARRWHSGSDAQSLTSETYRLGVYFVSTLPMYACHLAVGQAHQSPDAVKAFEFFGSPSGMENLLRFEELSGITGIGAAIFYVIAGLGAYQIVLRKQRAEWFLYAQGLLWTLIQPLLPSRYPSLFLFPAFLLLLLFGNGVLSAIFLLGQRLRKRDAAQRAAIYGAGFLAVSAYAAIFAVNTIFGGVAGVPYSPAFQRAIQQENSIAGLSRYLRTHSNDCAGIATVDRAIAAAYPALYGIEPYAISLSELQRFTALGRSVTYLIMPAIDDEQKDAARISRFLSLYYTEVFRSSGAVLYAVKDSSRQSQRYQWRDLLSGIGHHAKDDRSVTGIVKYVSKDKLPGLVAFGPFARVCESGQYTARFALRADSKTPEPIAMLEVVADNYTSLSRRQLTGADFPDDSIYYTFDVDFNLDLSGNPAFQSRQLQFTVYFLGQAEFRVDYVDLLR